MRPSSKTCFLVASVLALSGCDRVNRVKECRRLSSLVNPALDAIQAQTQTGAHAGYRAAASRYGALAKALRKTPEWRGPGKSLVKEYAELVEAVSPAVTAYATALEEKQEHSLVEARRTLGRLSAQQSNLVNRINSYCQTP